MDMANDKPFYGEDYSMRSYVVLQLNFDKIFRGNYLKDSRNVIIFLPAEAL